MPKTLRSYQFRISHLLVIFLLLGCVVAWRPFTKLAYANWFALQVMQAMVGDSKHADITYNQLLAQAPNNPRAEWFLGLLAGRMKNYVQQYVHWSAFLNNSKPEALSLVRAGAPNNLELAQHAFSIFPNYADSWFWLAGIFARGDRNTDAVLAYQRGLQLDAGNGLAWCSLGNLLRTQDKLQARDAYLKCCWNSDPGSNGCINAGSIEEELGNWQNAIRYYRLSRWAKSHHRADELEIRLTPTP